MRIDGDTAICDRCEETYPLADVSMLEKDSNPDYERIVCESCLDAVGVPGGYTLTRDVTHFGSGD